MCLSTPGVGVERAHLSSGWGSQQRHGPEPSDRAPGSGGFLGEKAARASGSLPHTLASLVPPADQMRVAAGSSERWRHSSTVANRPVFHPELVPRTRAIPLGTAETGASFWPPGTAGPRLSLWPRGAGRGSSPVSQHEEGARRTSANCHRLSPKGARGCRQPGRAPSRREMRRTGWGRPPTACLLRRSFRNFESQVWVLPREGPALRGTGSGIRQIQAPIRPPPPAPGSRLLPP